MKYEFTLVARNHTFHCLAAWCVCVAHRRRIDSHSVSHHPDNSYRKAVDRQTGCLRPNDAAREKGEELRKVIVKERN